MITASMDMKRFNSRLGELHDALAGAGQPGMGANVVEDTARGFLSRVIALTPPKTQTQGQEAVKRDLGQIFTAVDAGLQQVVGEKYGMSNVYGWFTTSAGNKQQVIWDKIDPSGDGMRKFHLSQLNSRGRTRKLKKERAGGSAWYAPYVVTKEVMAEYLAMVQSRVGRKKAAWAVSALSLGMKVAAWIRNQIPHAKGNCVNALNNTSRPSVTMTSAAPGVKEDERVINAALKYSFNAMGRQMKMVAQGLTGDWNRGLKFAKRAGITGRLMEVYAE